MQPNTIPPHILRNSYGYQVSDHFNMKNGQFRATQVQPFQHVPPSSESSNINLYHEGRIEGMDHNMKKNGHLVDNSPQSNNYLKAQYGDNKTRTSHVHLQQPRREDQFNEQQLRGSCSNVLKKFDSSNLRNTTQFNPVNKFGNTVEMKKSPIGEESNHFKSHAFNRNSNSDHSTIFLKLPDNSRLEHTTSFINHPSKTPTKFPSEKNLQLSTNLGQSKTPNKYKNVFENNSKLTQSIKTSPETNEQKKIFKSLNQIMENKNKEKMTLDSSRAARKTSKTINGFQFGNVLGKGKFGEVFLARHSDTGFIVAIKKVIKSKVVQFKMVDQFTKQIKLHSCLDHPNIVKFYGVFQEKDSIFLIMEYMNGGTLFDYLNEVNYLNIKQAVEYLRDIIEALAYMHEKSIAHRDIKPENIVLSSEGVAKLCDFGWSALVETSRKTYCGTFDYAPPQILQRKNYDTSVDIWCIGVLTYELLTGRVPFEGQKRNIIMDKILNVDKNKIDYPANVPSEAREFIESLVQKDPSLRPKCQDLLNFRLFNTYPSKVNKSKRLQ